MALRAHAGALSGLLGLGAVAIVLPFAANAGQLSTATFVLIAAIGATGLNIVTGFAGQISLGHAFFLAIGAYTAAWMGADHHLNALLWLPAAALVAALFGAIVGPMALRLRGLYLAIVTLALIFVGQYAFLNLTGLTGGPEGRAFPAVALGPIDFSPGATLSLGGLTIDSNGLYYYLALVLLAGATAFTRSMYRSRTGRAMVAVRERELPAALMGINVGAVKVGAFVASSALAGVAGALYASYLSFAQPEQWSLLLSIQYIAAIVVGGMGTVPGPVLGSIVVFALPSLLKQLPFLPEAGSGGLSAGDLASITYGVLIVTFLTLEPRGLVGLAQRGRRVRARLRGGASQVPVNSSEEAFS